MDISEIFKVPAAKKQKISDQEFQQKWAGKEDSTQEDEDSRLYGSGVGEKEQEIMDLVDQVQDKQFDLASIKKLISKFEKSASKNLNLRAKYSSEPLKYVESEADLAQAINSLNVMSSFPEYYPLIAEPNTTETILGLLAHENTDIAIAVVALLNELVDEDLVDLDSEKAVNGMSLLVNTLVKKQALPLLIDNLERLNDDIDDKQGIFNTLSIIENMVSIDPLIVDKLLETRLIKWILQRLDSKNFDSVRQYASEILSIIVINEKAKKVVGKAGLEVLLKILSQYRKKDPQDADEVELFHNLFDVLCLLLSVEENKALFLEAEGFELMLLMIKQMKMARMCAFKVLSHALTGATIEQCSRFIDILGLKSVFAALMQKGVKKYKKEYSEYSQKEQDEYIVSILAALFKTVQDPEHLQRLYYKFIENDHEKLEKLVELFHHYQQKDLQVEQTKEDEEHYLDRLDSGLFTLQLISILMLQLSLNPTLQSRIEQLLKAHEYNMETIAIVAQEYAENLGDDEKVQSERSRVVQLISRINIQI